MEQGKKVIFFKEQIIVERSSSNSAQAVVFFGKEASMGFKVVLKQYKGDTFNEIIREIKLFTQLEKERHQSPDKPKSIEVLSKSNG